VADKVFTITEMKRVSSSGGASAFTPSGVSFEWTADEHNIPANSWAMPIAMRTSRTDLPGAEEPVEQILGWNFEPFTCTGVWDDRYMGAGAAFDTFKEFELLVKRGNLVRFEFERVTMHGIITGFTPDYKRRTRSAIRSPSRRITGPWGSRFAARHRRRWWTPEWLWSKPWPPHRPWRTSTRTRAGPSIPSPRRSSRRACPASRTKRSRCSLRSRPRTGSWTPWAQAWTACSPPSETAWRSSRTT
jgi:hypothetical protein